MTVATKGGLTGTPPQIRVDGSRAALRTDLQASLRALNTDYLDLYYLHTLDPRVPVEDSIGAMAEFVAEGVQGGEGERLADLTSRFRTIADREQLAPATLALGTQPHVVPIPVPAGGQPGDKYRRR